MDAFRFSRHELAAIVLTVGLELGLLLLIQNVIPVMVEEQPWRSIGILGLSALALAGGLMVLLRWVSAQSKAVPDPGLNRNREGQAPEAALVDRERVLRRGVDVLITWLYRRENWHGLSHDGRYAEPAPEDIWGSKKYQDLELEGLEYRPPRIVPPEPGFAPPPYVPIAPEFGEAPPPEPSPWLPDPLDLATFEISDDQLEECLDRTQATAQSVLAPDAQVEFIRLLLVPPSPILEFVAWSKIADRSATLTVDHISVSCGVPWSGGFSRKDATSGETDWSYRAAAPPWRADSDWRKLLVWAWYRVKPDVESLELSPVLPPGVENQTGWSRWHVTAFNAARTASRFFGLRNGELEEVAPSG